jgi:hypothetical protein
MRDPTCTEKSELSLLVLADERHVNADAFEGPMSPAQ